MATLIKTDKNGTRYYEGYVPCDRCGGNGGADVWKLTGWTCYKCGGEGKILSKWKVYTPEYEEKLEAQRAKRRAKWEADHAEEIAEQNRRIAEEEARREAERIAEEKRIAEEQERKAQSQHIGQIGDKIEMSATLERIASFMTRLPMGYGEQRMYIYTFRTDDGNALIWKTTKGIDFEQDERVNLKGTIKDHSEYKDEKQTVLTRCKVTK